MAPLSRNRLFVVIGVIVVLGGIVLAQLFRLQVLEHARWDEIAQAGRTGYREVWPERGRIWDRNDTLLVGNEPRFAVWVDASAAKSNLDVLVRDIVPALDLTPEDVRRTLDSGQAYFLLKTDLPAELGEQLLNKPVRGVDVIPYWQRYYSDHTLASSVLGFYNAEGKGYYGVEGFYNAVLAGTESVFEVDQDAWRDPLPLGAPAEASAHPGADLVLTIDRTAQMIVEDELAQALERTGATSGLIIVMNPRTGEILAMANAPGYDPNAYTETAVESPDRFINPAVSENYEPGSVFKIITLAAALDSGIVSPETTYDDTACIEVGGQSLCNWDRKAHGVVSMVDMMAKSLNVGAATLSTRMGAPVYYSYVQAFGFGQATGVDLQGEEKGRVRVPTDVDWYESDLGTNSFGQGLSVTPLQMIAAVAAVANDGVRVQPHIVQSIVEGDRVRAANVVELGRPIRAETAHTLTNVLVEAVEREVPQAQVPGYRVAGKTGTAQIPIPGGYDDPWTIGSFIGYSPAADPQLIILVRLDRTTISPWGSDTAAPVFQRVATRLFAVLGIAPDNVVTAR